MQNPEYIVGIREISYGWAVTCLSQDAANSPAVCSQQFRCKQRNIKRDALESSGILTQKQ